MNCLVLKKIITFIYFLTIIKRFVAESEPSWTFELKSITSTSSNKDLLEFNLKNERVSRGVYALSGEFHFNYDIVQSDSNEISVQVFRSQNNDGDYKKLPFDVPRDHFYNIINSHYKSTLMNSLHECSDMPYFENEVEVPMEKKTYKLNKCNVTQEGLPSHLDEGTYKIVFNGYGDVEWEVVIIVEVSSNE